MLRRSFFSVASGGIELASEKTGPLGPAEDPFNRTSIGSNEADEDANRMEIAVGDGIIISKTGGTAELDYSRTGFLGNFDIGESYGENISESYLELSVQPDSGPGYLGGTYRAEFEIRLNNDSDLLGSETIGVSGRGVWFFEAEHTVARPTASSGQASFGSGEKLENVGLTYGDSTFSNPTEVDIRDSGPLSQSTTVTIDMENFTEAQGEGAENLSGDIANVEGLDGELFVLQMSYDELTAINQFGSESATTLLWFDVGSERWVNAVLGNSDGGAGAKRFASSYDTYLSGAGGTPELSAYGIDLSNNVVWAVLDHNSSFAPAGVNAVPEPSTVFLMLLSGAYLIFWKNRRR